jgi:hypothetical protein
MRRVLLAVLAVGLFGAAGCSGDTSAPALSDSAGRQLQADVLAVTTSAAAHKWVAARSSLTKLRTDLAAAKTAGTVSVARADAIDAAVAAVNSDLAAMATSATPSAPSTTAVATPTTRPKPTPLPKPTKTHKRGHGGGDG